MIKSKVGEACAGGAALFIAFWATLSRSSRANRFIKIELNKADPITIKKLLNSLDMGAKSESLDASKIRFLTNFSNDQGRAFEVRIIGNGHQRLFECLQKNVFRIMIYDPASPATGGTISTKYHDLCR